MEHDQLTSPISPALLAAAFFFFFLHKVGRLVIGSITVEIVNASHELLREVYL